MCDLIYGWPSTVLHSDVTFNSADQMRAKIFAKKKKISQKRKNKVRGIYFEQTNFEFFIQN